MGDKLHRFAQLDSALRMAAMALGRTEITEGSDAQAKKVAQDAAAVIAAHHDLLEAAARDVGVPAELFRADTEPRLVLITCGGAFHDGSYSHNVVLFAEPLDGRPRCRPPVNCIDTARHPIDTDDIRKVIVMCSHQPPCPPVDRADRAAARVIASHPEQGWSMLCNGMIVFDDTGELLPDGRAVAPHRPAAVRVPVPA